MPGRLDLAVSEQAHRHASGRAVVGESGSCTYEDLERRSNRIAHQLRAGGVTTGSRVCVLVPKSADGIQCVLGALKAGAAYVPLDVTGPARRLANVLADCAPCALIADSAHGGKVSEALAHVDPSSHPRLWWLGSRPGDEPHGEVLDGGRQDSGPEVAASGDDLAYIMFTSGSTGTPKGVPITHASACQHIAWAVRYFWLSPDDRASGSAPLHFDVSVFDTFATLASGAELHLLPPRAHLLPSLTARYIREAELTQWNTVPSVLAGMAGHDVLADHDFPALRRVIWGGDALAVPDLRYWMRRLPHVEFTALYGTTETAVSSSYHTFDSTSADELDEVPIGVPIPGEEMLVVDPRGAPARVGDVGELLISGAGLSPGYWRRPEQTRAAFCEIPRGSGRRWYRTGDLARVDSTGVFHFHGRVDRQVKSRGHRIELDEVGAALAAVPDIAESAVVAVPVGGFEGHRICAACVGGGVELDPVELKTALADRLPGYMIPRSWRILDALPKHHNGKVDYLTLQNDFREEAQ